MEFGAKNPIFRFRFSGQSGSGISNKATRRRMNQRTFLSFISKLAIILRSRRRGQSSLGTLRRCHSFFYGRSDFTKEIRCSNFDPLCLPSFLTKIRQINILLSILHTVMVSYIVDTIRFSRRFTRDSSHLTIMPLIGMTLVESRSILSFPCHDLHSTVLAKINLSAFEHCQIYSDKS